MLKLVQSNLDLLQDTEKVYEYAMDALECTKMKWKKHSDKPEVSRKIF